MADKKRVRFGEVVHHKPVFISENVRIMTTVTSHANAVHDWIEAVKNRYQFDVYRLVVGFDLKLGHAPTAVSLLLLYVSPKCLIFDLAHAAQIPPSLSQFLADRDNLFVGVDMQSKLAQLQREFGFGGGAPNVDLAILTAAKFDRPEMNAAGVSELRAFVLKGGDEVERPAVEDIWDGGQLSNEHVRSACIDAYTCFELGGVLVSPELKPIVDLICPDLDESADLFFDF